MAKGMRCPQCDYYMYAVEEVEKPAGTEVIYQCRSCDYRLRTFEPK